MSLSTYNTYYVQLTQSQLHYCNYNLGAFSITVAAYDHALGRLQLVNDLGDMIQVINLETKLNIKTGTLLNVTESGVIDLNRYLVSNEDYFHQLIKDNINKNDSCKANDFNYTDIVKIYPVEVIPNYNSVNFNPYFKESDTLHLLVKNGSNNAYWVTGTYSNSLYKINKDQNIQDNDDIKITHWCMLPLQFKAQELTDPYNGSLEHLKEIKAALAEDEKFLNDFKLNIAQRNKESDLFFNVVVR